MNSSREDPSVPIFLTGKPQPSIVVSSSKMVNPKSIPESKNNPLVSYLTNKSFEKRDKKKGPTYEPLPMM